MRSLSGVGWVHIYSKDTDAVINQTDAGPENPTRFILNNTKDPAQADVPAEGD